MDMRHYTDMTHQFLKTKHTDTLGNMFFLTKIVGKIKKQKKNKPKILFLLIIKRNYKKNVYVKKTRLNYRKCP